MKKRDANKSAHMPQDELVPEEFPEGAYGSSIGNDDPIFSKSTPSKKDKNDVYPT